MDPTSLTSKFSQSVKDIIILLAALSVCIGFFFRLIDDQAFMPFVYTVIGAAFGRTMSGGMAAFTKTTETGPDGVKRETTVSTPPSVPTTSVTVTPPSTQATTGGPTTGGTP